MDAGIYAVKPNTLLDAIKLFQIYGFNIVAYNQSWFSACIYNSLNKNGFFLFHFYLFLLLLVMPWNLDIEALLTDPV